MSISYDDFTRRLKEERIRNQLTQRAMSKIVQMYPSHYCKVERDYNRFSLVNYKISVLLRWIFIIFLQENVIRE